MKVIVQNLAVEYSDEGSGPAILMLHGWMNDLRNFDELAAKLKDKYRIIRLDLPGFGKSETPPLSWHIGDYALFVRDFTRKLGFSGYALLGHSFGGRVAIKGASNGMLHPTHLILIDAAGFARRRTLRNQFFTLVAKLGKALTSVPPLSLFRRELRKKMYHALGSDYFAASALSGIFLNAIAEDLSDAAALISVPTLLIWGSKDTSTPLEEGKRVSTIIKNSRLEILDDVGHAPHIERPDEVVRLIKQFSI